MARQTDIQHLNVIYQNGENEQARVLLTPTCPTPTYARPTPREQTSQTLGAQSSSIIPPFNNSFVCINQVKDCYCARNWPEILYPCVKQSKK